MERHSGQSFAEITRMNTAETALPIEERLEAQAREQDIRKQNMSQKRSQKSSLGKSRTKTLSEIANQLDIFNRAVKVTRRLYRLRTDLVKAKMRKQQVAKSQSIRWKQELRRLAAKEVSTTLYGQDKEIKKKEKDVYKRKARPQAYKIRYALKSFLF